MTRRASAVPLSGTTFITAGRPAGTGLTGSSPRAVVVAIRNEAAVDAAQSVKHNAAFRRILMIRLHETPPGGREWAISPGVGPGR